MVLSLNQPYYILFPHEEAIYHNFIKFRFLICRDLRTLHGVKFGLKDLLCVKIMTFRNSAKTMPFFSHLIQLVTCNLFLCISVCLGFLFDLSTRSFSSMNGVQMCFHVASPDLEWECFFTRYRVLMLFYQIWSGNAWGKESKSGPGSLLKNTNSMRSQFYSYVFSSAGENTKYSMK